MDLSLTYKTQLFCLVVVPSSRCPSRHPCVSRPPLPAARASQHWTAALCVSRPPLPAAVAQAKGCNTQIARIQLNPGDLG
eukprot:3023350-Alexandrium_andersonii.AAC.1